MVEKDSYELKLPVIRINSKVKKAFECRKVQSSSSSTISKYVSLALQHMFKWLIPSAKKRSLNSISRFFVQEIEPFVCKKKFNFSILPFGGYIPFSNVEVQHTRHQI